MLIQGPKVKNTGPLLMTVVYVSVLMIRRVICWLLLSSVFTKENTEHFTALKQYTLKEKTIANEWTANEA